MLGGSINYGVGLSYTPMFAATFHVVHIDPDRSHSGIENGHKIISITKLQRVNPIPEDERMMHFDK
jgi:hypothetical protein